MTRKTSLLVVLVILSLLVLVAVNPAWAGPGGMIAKAVTKSFWGRLVLGALVIVFLPLLIYVTVKEKVAERRARRDLRFMAAHDPLFDWLKLRERIQDCFHRIHSAWRQEDMAEATAWMTDWYWQNQQMVFLDRWQREGLVNHCSVKTVGSIKPLLFAHRNDGGPHEGSMVVVSITAHMQDYLSRREDGEVVEGDKKWKDVETIWSFNLEEGIWRVANIEASSTSLEYAKIARELPEIQSTLVESR